MLKIKDSVDLKELEKFGFVKVKPYSKSFESSLIAHRTCYMEGTKYEDKDHALKIVIDINSKEMDIDPIIYDLIKADLIEKVKE
jgi:hypothetical protein